MQWESEEQDEQSYQVIDLGSRQGSDCHTHTVLSVLVIGEDVKCCLCVLKRFPNTYCLAHVKKHSGPPHAVLRTMEN